MPDEDIPPGLQVLEGEEDIKPLSNDQKYLSIDLFDDLKEAHDRMTRGCGKLSTLVKGLTSSQLMLVMKSMIRPMIQLNTTAAFLDTQISQTHKKDVPQDRGERV